MVVPWDPQSTPLLQRIERTRRVVSLCSQAIIRAYDEEALLAEECRILIDVGGYSMAWVGSADPTAPTRIMALAHAGMEPSGVRGATPPWSSEMGPRSPTARAIREQRPQVVRGIPGNPRLRALHPDAEGLGYGSMCAFPIQFGPHGAGALTVYAQEADAFATEEVALLRELAGDMAVGVASLRAKRESDRLEDELEAAEQRFRALIENAPVAVFQVTQDGRTLVANQALADLLGYASSAEILGQATPVLAQHLAERDQERVLEAMRVEPPLKPLEMRLRRRDGSHVWVALQARPGFGQGEPVLEAFLQDLTSVRAAQLASARLAAVVEASDEAVIGMDAEGTVQAWSSGAARLYGFSEAEAIGRPFGDLCVPPDRRGEWTRAMEALRAGRHVDRFETVRLGKQHRPCAVSVAASPILDAGGHVVGASLIEHDIAPRKRAEAMALASERQAQEVARLQSLTRMRAEFLSQASHELNTPLTPILLQLQALKDLPRLDAGQALGIASIERNVLRLATLVKDLATASSLGQSELELVPTEVDLQKIVLDAVAAFRDQARQAGVTLRMTQSPEPVLALADGERLMQVLFNLLGNALKFTPRGGEVTATAANGDEGPEVAIQDTGVGFESNLQEDLFRPFGRLHADEPGTPAGTGLGLFISKGIIEGLGGTIRAESPGRGQGATISFRLPAASAPGRGIVAVHGFGPRNETKPKQAPDAPNAAAKAAGARKRL